MFIWKNDGVCWEGGGGIKDLEISPLRPTTAKLRVSLPQIWPAQNFTNMCLQGAWTTKVQ